MIGWEHGNMAWYYWLGKVAFEIYMLPNQIRNVKDRVVGDSSIDAWIQI
jgi:hypothetical protein